MGNMTRRKEIEKSGRDFPNIQTASSCRHRKAEYQSFIRPAVCQDGETDGHDDGVGYAFVFFDPRQRSQRQGAAQSDDRAAPVAVHPVTEKPEAQHRHQSAQESPCRGHPSLQHPRDRRAHEGSYQQLPDPGMPQPLAGSQNQPLCRSVHRHIGRLLNDMEALEVLPHGMRRVGHASVREGVGREQIAEFIIPARHGNSKDRDQGKAKGDHQQPDCGQGQGLSP